MLDPEGMIYHEFSMHMYAPVFVVQREVVTVYPGAFIASSFRSFEQLV